MGLFAHLKTMILVQLVMGYIFFTSGLVVNFLMLCSCVVWPFSKNLYRKINVHLAWAHWSQFTFLAQWWSGSDVILYMKKEDYHYLGKEHSLALLNHKFDIDWLAAWVLTERFGLLGSTKVFSKEALRYVPLIGWAWYFTETIFLKRNYEEDKKSILQYLQRACDFPEGYYVTLLLFPEGTRFTEKGHQTSLEVCRAKGYPETKHVLLPRPKGFTLSVHALKGHFPAIYNCTVGFDKDAAPPTLMSLVNGKSVKGHFYIERIPFDQFQPDTDEECAKWLRGTFKEKDDVFDKFLQTGTFPGQSFRTKRRYREFFMWLFWAIVLCVPLFWYIASIFAAGTLLQQLAVPVVIVLGSFIIKYMISVTQIDNSSKPSKNGVKKSE